MRGDRDREEARKLITDAATEAQVVLATAERKRYASTAFIIGPDGHPLFHILSTWWSRMVAMGYAVMLGIILLMAILVYYNKAKLNILEEKVDETDQRVEQKVDKK